MDTGLMAEQNENDSGRSLWNAAGLRRLPPHVSPSIRGEKQKPAEPDKSTDEKEED